MKERLDVLLVKGGHASSREKAKAILMAGIVYVNGQKEDKPGATFDPEKIQIEVRGKTLPYVSRGGLKLEKALAVFDIGVRDLVCLDIGASTGGFTDCMLQNGAAKIYAVDVGYGQLDYKLRNDPRVICMEKTNFRYMEEGSLPEKVSFAASDVSFISLTKMLAPAYSLLADDGQMAVLIKPQFEAGREKVGKKGVVTDPKVHLEVIVKVCLFAQETGFTIAGLDYSPIKGPEGNIEFLLFLKKKAENSKQLLTEEEITLMAQAVVEKAAAQLGENK
ncbi:MAG: TlyA family RNA methyltransferase [Lachnospiraceae bacterium]|nr:TlyA family RNA methyltransferase [Lachnospiraceae bacterium]